MGELIKKLFSVHHGCWWVHLRSILKNFDPRPFELYCGATSIAWALWMTIFYHDNSNGFVMMPILKLMPLWAWIAFRIVFGGLQIYGVATMTYEARKWAALMSCGGWWIVCYAFAVNIPSTAAVPFMSLFSVMTSAVYIRISITGRGYDTAESVGTTF